MKRLSYQLRASWYAFWSLRRYVAKEHAAGRHPDFQDRVFAYRIIYMGKLLALLSNDIIRRGKS